MTSLRRAMAVARSYAGLRELVIFGIIGLAATATHVAGALWADAQIHLPPMAANGLGYVAGFAVSYFGNARLTFRRPAMHGSTFLRYVGVSAVGLVLSEGLTFVCATLLGWPFAFALIPVVTLAPLVSFVLTKSYAFADRETVGQAG